MVTTNVATLSTIGGASLALVGISTLIILLVKKELLQASRHEGALRLSRILNVAIVPLLIVFVITVVMKVIAALQ
jgi:hypothetical protein